MSMHSKSVARTRRGLTLVEMLMTVTLIGTVAAIGLPKVNSTSRQRRLMAAASVVAGDVEAAFSVAARQRRPVRLTYDSGLGEVQVADRASGTIYSHRPLGSSSEYKLDAVSMSASSVDLFPNGLSSAGFTLTLTNGSFRRQVVVTRTGLTRVVVP